MEWCGMPQALRNLDTTGCVSRGVLLAWQRHSHPTTLVSPLSGPQSQRTRNSHVQTSWPSFLACSCRSTLTTEASK